MMFLCLSNVTVPDVATPLRLYVDSKRHVPTMFSSMDGTLHALFGTDLEIKSFGGDIGYISMQADNAKIAIPKAVNNILIVFMTENFFGMHSKRFTLQVDCTLTNN